MKALARIALPIALVSSTANAGCFDYNFDHRVQLTGEVARKTFPGRPNFESIANGDEPETYIVFKLKSPICVHPAKDDLDDDPADNVYLMQMLLTSNESISYFRSLMNKTVVLEGSFFSAITGHHHTPVLFQNVKFVKVVNS